ncbi:septum formation initiator family protein [candidate division KSB1 bacterium]|nr:septum formation initiator family protein [candidate division KSB1 bacterium]
MPTQKRKKVQQSKSPQKQRLNFIIIIIALLVVYLFLQGDNGLVQYVKLQSEKNKLIKEIDALKQENERLKREIELLNNSDAYIEKQVREKKYMGKDDEKIYIINSPDKE